MKAYSIASEHVPHFFVRLRKRHMDKWFVHELNATKKDRQHFNHEYLNKELEIDQIGFYKNHFWFHFKKNNNSGWIPNKFIRKNYRVLKLSTNDQLQDDSSIVAGLITMINFANPSFDIRSKILNPNETLSLKMFRKFLVNSVGSYKNLNKKSYRGIRSQINRNRPVIIWGSDNDKCIILFGFNHREFFCFDLSDRSNKTISVSNLTKIWKRSGYKAVSY